MFPVKVVKAEDCRNELIKAIKEHLNNYVKKDENKEDKYNGMISIINVGEKVPEETIEIVNDLCKIDEIIEEEPEEKEKDNENEKDKDKDNKENKEPEKEVKEEVKNN